MTTGEDASREIVDGGDRACGELLLVLAARARGLAPRTVIRLLASDPAAAVDLPAWCHLTGHDYLGAGVEDDARRYYDLRTSATARATDGAQPWRLTQDSPQKIHPNREEHP